MNRPSGSPLSEGHPTIRLPESSMHLQPLPSLTPQRNGQISLSTFSPVNENGSFAFDRVLKTGKVHRRIKHKHVSALGPEILSRSRALLIFCSRLLGPHGNQDILFFDRISYLSTKMRRRQD